jgi:co-chaperonin GroES (HSP10)
MLVELDPLPEKKGSIFLVGSGAERLRTATVLRVGPGRWRGNSSTRVPVGVEPGEKVAFWRENLEHQAGKQVMGVLADLGDNLGLIRATDVLYAYAEK